MSSVRKYKYLYQIIIICLDIDVVSVDMQQPCMDALVGALLMFSVPSLIKIFYSCLICRHGKRQIVGPDDVKLLVRKSPGLVSLCYTSGPDLSIILVKTSQRNGRCAWPRVSRDIAPTPPPPSSDKFLDPLLPLQHVTNLNEYV